MQWKLPALFALIALSSASSASSDREKWIPRCGGHFNLCGFVERDSEEERIPKRFEGAMRFSDGLAAVRIDGRFGYIDTTGRVVIEPQYEAAGPFTGGFAEVRVDGRSGAIDRTGRMVVPAQFDRLVPFTDGAFIAKPLRPGAQRSLEPARLDGEVRLEGLLDGLIGLSGGIYHLNKGWLTPQDLQFQRFDEPARSLIWAGKRNEHNDPQWGLLRSDGTWRVTPRYNHVQRINETRAVVTSMPDYSLPPLERRKTIRWGAVDRDGNLVVPLEFSHLGGWRGGYGYAQAKQSDALKGIMGRAIVLGDGSLLANRYFDEVDIREDGKLPRGRLDETWYSIEPSGRLVPDQLDGAPLIECAGGLTIVRRGEMVEFRRTGDTKAIAQFADGYFTKRDCPGPFSGSRKGKWFFILEDGTVLGGRTGFDNIYSFSGQYAAVEVAGKWGIIDRSGAFTVKPQFRKLRPGARDKFVVGEGKNVAWIDAKGAWIKEPVFPKPPPTQALACEGGLRFFSAEGHWGLQDGDGKTVIEPRYRALSCFRQGVTWTAMPGGTAWCPVGPEGKRREAMPCRETYYPMIVTHHYPEKFSDDRHDSSVLWSRAWLDYKAGTRPEPPKWLSDGARGEASYSVIPN